VRLWKQNAKVCEKRRKNLAFGALFSVMEPKRSGQISSMAGTRSSAEGRCAALLSYII
jgi:hypothetical protein